MAQRPKDRKAQIALAAAELFCERGYHGVGIDEIAEAVGITGPAVYRHFRNKYAILTHATRDLSSAVLAATAPPPAELPPPQRLDQILAALAALAVARRTVGGLYQWEGRFLEPDDRARLRADLLVLLERVTAPLTALRPDLRPERATLVARAMLSVMGSLSTHRASIGASRAAETLRTTGWVLLSTGLAHDDSGPASPTRPPRNREALTRRETIMAEALRLFHEHGYHRVSMEEIATACGTKASSLYRHFPGKADLLAAVYYQAADHVASTTTTALAQANDPTEVLHRLIDSYVDLVVDSSDLVSVYQTENMNLPAGVRHDLRKAQRMHVEEWVRILDAIRADIGPTECRILVHGALNLITDLSRSVHHGQLIADEMASLARTALMGRPAPRPTPSAQQLLARPTR